MPRRPTGNLPLENGFALLMFGHQEMGAEGLRIVLAFIVHKMNDNVTMKIKSIVF
jgi:hypothetical protein